jgi:polyhydroxybutyrate depolymerase
MLAHVGLDLPNLPVQTLDVGGRRRTFVSVAGPGPDAPLLLVLHGAGGTGLGMAALSQLSRRAPAAGCAALFPDGWMHVWNDNRHAPRLARREGIDDVAFMAALLEHARRSGLSDGRRVYAVGMSNGGMLAEHLARHDSIGLAGVVLVASSATATSRQARPVPARPARFLAFSGTADPLVPYGGGPIGPLGRLAGGRTSPSAAAHGGAGRGRGWVAPIEDVAADWASDGAVPTVEAVPGRGPGDLPVERVTWPDRVGTAVTLYRVLGGGHTWPGGAQYLPSPIVGRVATGLDATGILLDFVCGRAGAP